MKACGWTNLTRLLCIIPGKADSEQTPRLGCRRTSDCPCALCKRYVLTGQKRHGIPAKNEESEAGAGLLREASKQTLTPQVSPGAHPSQYACHRQSQNFKTRGGPYVRQGSSCLALTQMPACNRWVPTAPCCGSLLPNTRPAAMTFRTGPKQICAGMSRRASSTSLPRCLGANRSPAFDSLR